MIALNMVTTWLFICNSCVFINKFCHVCNNQQFYRFFSFFPCFNLPALATHNFLFWENLLNLCVVEGANPFFSVPISFPLTFPSRKITFLEVDNWKFVFSHFLELGHKFFAYYFVSLRKLREWLTNRKKKLCMHMIVNATNTPTNQEFMVFR